MKKKTIQFCTFSLLILSAISFSIGVNMNPNLKDTLLQNIEAMADDEIPDEVSMQCLSEDDATCVVGTFVWSDHYYSPH